MSDSNRARPADQALAVPVEPVSRLDPTGFDPSRIRAGDDVEYYIEGGWTVEDGKRVERERARVRVCCVYDPPKHGKYALGVVHPGGLHEGLLRLSEITAHHPAIAMEARQGGDGETRLHAKHDSAGRKASPERTNHAE